MKRHPSRRPFAIPARKLLLGAAVATSSVAFAPSAAAHPVAGFLSWEALGIAGLAIGGPAGAVVGGIVGAGVGSICTLVDPPDTFNAGLRADPSLIGFTLPNDGSFSFSLEGRAQSVVNTASLLIQQEKAIGQTRDRLSGALQLGNASYVASQTAWLGQYEAAAVVTSRQLTADVSSYVSELAIEHPEIANARLSAAEWDVAVTNAGNGIFSPQTLDIYEHYGLAPTFLGTLSSNLGKATRSDIDTLASMTYAQLLGSSALTCEQCVAPVPEPSMNVLSLTGLAMLGWFHRRRASGIRASEAAPRGLDAAG